MVGKRGHAKVSAKIKFINPQNHLQRLQNIKIKASAFETIEAKDSERREINAIKKEGGPHVPSRKNQPNIRK